MTELLNAILTSGFLQYLMLLLRMIAPVVALFVVWRSYTSFKKGLRRSDPVILLRDLMTHEAYPILYWENSLGRSKSCDIVLNDMGASRDHAVLMRRDLGWYICDTGSKSGVYVNGKKIQDRKIIGIGDIVTLGNTQLMLENTDAPARVHKTGFQGFRKQAASPFFLMFLATFVHTLMAVQLCLGTGVLRPEPLVPLACLIVIGWTLYIISRWFLHRVSFEVETVGFLISGIGIMLLSGQAENSVMTQTIAMIIGIAIFSFLIWFMGDLERVTKWRLAFAIGAIGLFLLNILLGTEVNGSKNWIIIGPFSIQPSELIKIAFVFVGTSTLDRLQTKKNIGEFIGFAAVCLGFLFLMRDFGTACIFFAGFLIIAFMRSGSIRTIALILAVAILGVMMILYFKPYVAERFAGWMHIWDDVYGQGFQQTRALTYIASGGFFGMGLGRGYLHYIPAGDSDLVFALLCEEQGLVMGYVILFALALFIMYARNDVTRSRSTFFSIASCAAAGLLLFQACMNVFGATDILPFTGVTLPFISSGGSSMMACWGLLAFIKASDERTYAVKRIRKKKFENAYSEEEFPIGRSDADFPGTSRRRRPQRPSQDLYFEDRNQTESDFSEELPDDIASSYAEKFNKIYRKDK